MREGPWLVEAYEQGTEHRLWAKVFEDIGRAEQAAEAIELTSEKYAIVRALHGQPPPIYTGD